MFVRVFQPVSFLPPDQGVDDKVFGKMATKDLIVLLSTSANIVSRHTSFVGVDKVGHHDNHTHIDTQHTLTHTHKDHH